MKMLSFISLFFVLFLSASNAQNFPVQRRISMPQNISAQQDVSAQQNVSAYHNLSAHQNLSISDTLKIKTPAFPKTFSGPYKPLKVIIDNYNRESFSYDTLGRLKQLLRQKLVEGKWVNDTRECYTLSGNKVTVWSSEEWIQGVWSVFARELYAYDNEGRLKTWTIERSYSGGPRTNESRYSYTYDSKGNILTYITEKWHDTKKIWINWKKDVYTYDQLGRVLIFQNERWDSIWNPVYRTTDQYDSKGNKVSSIHESFSAGATIRKSMTLWEYDEDGRLLQAMGGSERNGVMEFSVRAGYTYNTNGKLTARLNQEKMGAEWKNKLRYSYDYDSKGRCILDVIEQWEDSLWAYGIKKVFIYGDNNSTIEEVENWYNGAWSKSHRVESVYDLNGKLISITTQEGIDGSWVNQRKDLWEYENGNCTMIELDFWDNGAWHFITRVRSSYLNGNMVSAEISRGSGVSSLVPAIETINLYYNNSTDTIYYSCFAKLEAEYIDMTTGVEDGIKPAGEFSLSQNYPNPFNPSTTIKYSTRMEGLVSLNVYDALGRLVKTVLNEYKPSGTYSVNFDGSSLSSGVYLYTLESNGSRAVRKFILLK